jgi:quaternary ammonium compound-resistance protein SugE
VDPARGKYHRRYGWAGQYLLACIGAAFLPVGMAYAMWTGTGTIGLVLAGMLIFQDEMSWPRMCFMGLAFIGIIGLRFCETTG